MISAQYSARGTARQPGQRPISVVPRPNLQQGARSLVEIATLAAAHERTPTTLGASAPHRVATASVPRWLVAGDEEARGRAREPTVGSCSTTACSSRATLLSQEPTVASEEPTVASEEPTVATEEPTVASEEPTVVSSEPTADSEEVPLGSSRAMVFSGSLTVCSSEPTALSEEVAPSSRGTEPVLFGADGRQRGVGSLLQAVGSRLLGADGVGRRGDGVLFVAACVLFGADRVKRRADFRSSKSRRSAPRSSPCSAKRRRG